MLETHDIQGLLFSGYKKHPSAMYLFFSISETAPAKAWLHAVTPLVTSGGQDGKFARNANSSLNIAFTYKGMAKLGLSEATLATFSRPFVEGMAQENRARLLGHSPDQWTWGQPKHRIHLLLMLFANDSTVLNGLVATERCRASTLGLQELFVIESANLQGKEHFGFEDGIAQPDIAEYRPKKHKSNGPGNIIKAGEFILGYENEYGQKTNSPGLRCSPDRDPESDLVDGDLGRNGTYLVLQQLAQDVAGFWKMLEEQCRRTDNSPDRVKEKTLGAKMVGRWRDGTPMALSPNHDGCDRNTHNDFGYFQEDRYGYGCPLGAHIRRANPRDALLDNPEDSVAVAKRHRLLRRGRPYGPPPEDPYKDDGKERGLIFVALNANIERQFEFVQAAWISSPNFAGLYDEADPILGGRTKKPGVFTIPNRPIRKRRHNILSNVTVKGGAYFFLPSLRALKYLSR